MSGYASDTLATISQDGQVPQTRFKDARSVQDFVRRLIEADSKRSNKRARLNGLVDGNPPYKASLLREAGRADACNANWGIARSYMESGTGAFYDLFSEAPGYIMVKTDFGNDEEQETYSRVISEEADRILREDTKWDYNVQISQWDMVLHGCGPFLFEDSYCVLPRAVACGELKVPEFTKSDVGYWEIASLEATYYPPELYDFIKNAKAAEAMGWDVEYTKLVIANAMDVKQQNRQLYDWEFYQHELKHNSLAYYDDSKVCRLAHVFWKEFDGKITHTIVERETTVGTPVKSPAQKQVDIKFLFRKEGRYRNFTEAVHPMYFDHGNGGYHHSVTGLGVKMFSAMEYQNRLICNLCDKAFAPKMLFKPTTTESTQKFQLAHFGDYGVLSANFDWTQTGVAGLMNDGLAMNKEITELVSSNLSSYRQQPMKQDGNPPTARQVMFDASQQAALSKTQFNRYYEQLDMLYTEIYRRLSNLNSTDERAKEFQKRCQKRGVPEEAIGRVRSVQATRVVGQGSAFVRKQSLNQLWITLGPTLPEDGRDNLVSDMIAAEAGQSAVMRYNPKRPKALVTDQESEARQWVGLMKIGVQPVVTSSQNPVVFAQTYLQAAAQAVATLQQGANPMEVLSFLNVAGPAIMAQMQRYANDPTRAALYKVQAKQWKQLAQITDKLKMQFQKAQQNGGQQQQRTQSAMNDEQLKTMKTMNDIKLKQVKTQAQLKQSEDKHRLKIAQGVQDLQLKDASTAAEIHRNRMKSMSNGGSDES